MKEERGTMEYPKKLIEVALPLDDINSACAYEKMPGIGPHPRGIHHWWARRPLAAARAVLFAQMVNDPGGYRGWGASKGQTKEDAQRQREQLFQIMRDLVKWQNTSNEEVLEKARREIRNSWIKDLEVRGDNAVEFPQFLDPFAGGGAIPLEAQRLGLVAHASDLNPIAVLINKTQIEIPPKFADLSPVGPIPKLDKQKTARFKEDWNGARGLAEDVRRYGSWIRDEAEKRIGYLYPQVVLPQKYGGSKATVIAWLWARSVTCPNPACGCQMPLIRSFQLSTKKNNRSWVKPEIDQSTHPPRVVFKVHTGEGECPQGTVSRKGVRCVCCDNTAPFSYVRREGKSGRIGTMPMATVAQGKRRRIYLNTTKKEEAAASLAKPPNFPETKLPEKALGFRIQEYGMVRHRDLFTARQLVALTTLCDLVQEARDKIISDAKAAGRMDDGIGLDEGGDGATAYADAIVTYLAFAVDRTADFNNTLTGWRSGNEKIMKLFNLNAIPMVWDFGEANLLANVVGGFITNVEYQSKCLQKIFPYSQGIAYQADAATNFPPAAPIISTDPPYYDNVGYADLSDFFYIWLRRMLKTVFPNIFTTMLVPKHQELVATPFRHGNKEQAEAFFMDGMTQAMSNMAKHSHPMYPVTIYYAFKQSETKDIGTASTGWEAFLGAVIKAGFSITGTWPLRTEQGIRSRSQSSNALASSILLVCRKRPNNAETISRKQFLRELENELPIALDDMIGGKEGASPIAPVDLAQAAIGPGMAVFTNYIGVLEADGSPMSVHTALILINKALDEYFTRAESNMGSDTRFCVDWFQQYGFKAGPFGEADVLARAKATSVEGLGTAGVVESGGGEVRLLRLGEYPDDWDPQRDMRVPIWEACHHICRALQESEMAAGELLARMPEKAEPIRQLAYRLYTLCERKGWAQEALLYNGLITSWRAILEASHEIGHRDEQLSFDV